MIEVKYFAADIDIDKDPSELYISFSNKADSEEPIGYYPLDELEFPIKRNERVDNYANFFGEGLDLYDDSIMLVNDEDHHIGYIPPYDARNDQDNTIRITWSGSELPTFKNGLTIIFNKYVCKGVDVYANYDQGGRVKIGSYYGTMGLPLKTHIPFELDANSQDELLSIEVDLYGFFDNTPYNIKGIVLGKTIDIEDIKSFDMLTEVNPISDDLSINETNITVVVDEDFNSNYGQKVLIYDNDKLLYDNLFISSEETEENTYNIKIRDYLDKADKTNYVYPFIESSNSSVSFVDWTTTNLTLLSGIFRGISVGIKTDDSKLFNELMNTKIKSLLQPSLSLRAVVQQVAWALCCLVDTTYNEFDIKINLIPFFASETTTPDIVINNDDDRILKTSVKNGTVYSKILWKKKVFYTSGNETTLGTYNYEGTANIVFDKPVVIYRTSISDKLLPVYNYSPYEFKVETYHQPDVRKFDIDGWELKTREDIVTIYTGNTKGETLEITNQTLYPADDTKKIAQLRKWYTNNNTLTATVVDNDSEIQVGKIVKIQLKKGNYFQGVVTSVVRTNINDYHTVELEAHEWN